jgi:hypothetical protein
MGSGGGGDSGLERDVADAVAADRVVAAVEIELAGLEATGTATVPAEFRHLATGKGGAAEPALIIWVATRTVRLACPMVETPTRVTLLALAAKITVGHYWRGQSGDRGKRANHGAAEAPPRPGIEARSIHAARISLDPRHIRSSVCRAEMIARSCERCAGYGQPHRAANSSAVIP